MTALLTMYDDIDPALLPATATAVAGYVDGRFANLTAIRARFPHAQILTIAVFPADDADCLDVEPGDATRADIFAWFKRQQARGVQRPVVYSSVVNMDGINATMTANGFPRDSWRAWSAHYGQGEHICGPSTCKLTSVACDGTQFTDRALSRSLDESVLLPGFFGSSPGPGPGPQPPGPQRHVVPNGNTQSLDAVAAGRSTTMDHIVTVSMANLSPEHATLLTAYLVFDKACETAGINHATMPTGMVYYTGTAP